MKSKVFGGLAVHPFPLRPKRQQAAKNKATDATWSDVPCLAREAPCATRRVSSQALDLPERAQDETKLRADVTGIAIFRRAIHSTKKLELLTVNEPILDRVATSHINASCTSPVYNTA